MNDSNGSCQPQTSVPVDNDSFEQELLPAEDVGCMDANEGCGDFPTNAWDERGNCWYFMDTCIPRGWEVADQSSECSWM